MEEEVKNYGFFWGEFDGFVCHKFERFTIRVV
jgi:uncharacterized protein (UPF0548 family)